MEQLKEQIRSMVDGGKDWYDVMLFIYQQEETKRRELYWFAETVFMEDELTEESRDDYRVLERMWNRIMFRIRNRLMSGRQALEWIDAKYAACVIGPVTHAELRDRIDDYLDEQEQLAREHREERMYVNW
jgi:hypothetical protein